MSIIMQVCHSCLLVEVMQMTLMTVFHPFFVGMCVDVLHLSGFSSEPELSEKNFNGWLLQKILCRTRPHKKALVNCL